VLIKTILFEIVCFFDLQLRIAMQLVELGPQTMMARRGGALVALWWHFGGTLVALWWHFGGTVVALWWHCGGTVVALWWQYGSG
jgi:hypothetical protein